MDRSEQDLTLPQELFLLALDEEKGTLRGGESKLYLGLAVVAELLLEGRLAVVEGSKRTLAVADPPAGVGAGDPLLDEALERVAAATKSAGLKTWAARASGIRTLVGKVAEGLHARGWITVDEGKILFVRRPLYRLADARPKREIVQRVHAAIFGGAHDLDARTAALVALAEGAGVLAAPFEKWQVRERKERIDRIVKGEIVDRGTPERLALASTLLHLSSAIKELKAARRASQASGLP